MKFAPWNDGQRRGFKFWCPGCECAHRFCVQSVEGPIWSVTGAERDQPSVSPSLLVTWPGTEKRCHSFVKGGKIQFLSDCSHRLAGMTVEVPDWEELD